MIWNRKTVFALLLICLFLCILICGCGFDRHGDEFFLKAAQIRSDDYFLNMYGVQTSYLGHEMLQTGANSFCTEIAVSNGSTVYHLLLDDQGKIITDDYAAQTAIQKTDIKEIQSIALEDGLSISDAEIRFDLEQYVVNVDIQVGTLLGKKEELLIWDLMTVFRENNIDTVTVKQITPEFLCSENTPIQLSAVSFDVEMTEEQFSEAYRALTEKVYWNQSKFDVFLKKAEELGCSNGAFQLSVYSGSAYEICFHYSGGERTAVDKLIKTMDQSYFSAENKEILFDQEKHSEKR